MQPLPDAPPLTDAAAINRRYRALRLRAIVALTLLYGFYYTCRIGLNVIKKPLIDLGIYDANQIGTIGSCLLGAYAVGKLVNGVIADRVNIGRFLPLGLMLSAFMNLAMGMNSLFVLACALWIMNGFFQGVGASASVKSLTHWYAGSERGRVYGIWSAAHAIGEGLTHSLGARIVEATSWKAAFIAPGLACIVVALAAFFILRDRPQAYGLPDVQAWKGEPHTDTTGSTREAQLEVLKNPAVWIVALASALMYVTRFGINNWGVTYFQVERGYTFVEANDILGASVFAGILGSVSYGFISDLVFKGRRPPTTLFFGAVQIVALAVLFWGPRFTPLLIVSFQIYAFMLSGLLAVLGGLFAVDICSKKAAGMAMGFVGFVSYVGASIGEKITGRVLHGTTRVLPDGTKSFDFTIPVQMWVGAAIVSVLLAVSLWNVKPKE